MPSTLPPAILGEVPHWNMTFTRWVRFNDRSTLLAPWGAPALNYSGVYLIAHAPSGPPGAAADYLADEIVYVGKSDLLRRRLHQFERAMDEQPGHSGGNSYRSRFGGLREDVHVAVLPVWFGNDRTLSEQPLTSHFVTWAEARIVLELTIARRSKPDLVLLNKS